MQDTYNILLVENDKKSGKLIHDFLMASQLQFELKKVSDLNSGISEIKHQHPDVILVDNLISSGHPVQQFKKEAKSSNVPVILISDKIKGEPDSDLRRLGAEAAIFKNDLSDPEFREMIEQMVQKHKTTEKLHDIEQNINTTDKGFEQIFSRLNDGVVLISLGLKFVFVNEAGHQFLSVLGEKKLLNMVRLFMKENDQQSADWTMTVNEVRSAHFELTEIVFDGDPHYLVIIQDKSKEFEIQQKADHAEASFNDLYQAFPLPLLIHDHQTVLEANHLACVNWKAKKSKSIASSIFSLINESNAFDKGTGHLVEALNQQANLSNAAGVETTVNITTRPYSYLGRMVFLTTIAEDRTTESNSRQTSLHEIGVEIYRNLTHLINRNFKDLDEFIIDCIDLGCKIVELPFGYYGTYEDQDHFKIACTVGSVEGVSPGASFKLKNTPEHSVFSIDHPLILGDLKQSVDAKSSVQLPVRNMKACVAVPVISSGNNIGAMNLYADKNLVLKLTDQQTELLMLVAGMIGSAIALQDNIVNTNVDTLLDNAVIEGKEEIHARHLLRLASHDLKESVRVILNYTELVSSKIDQEGNENEIKSYLEYARKGAHKLEKIVEDFKFFLNIGEEEINKTSFDTGQVIEDLLLDHKEGIEASGASLSVGSMPVIIADRTAIKTIFSHLIDNALKFRKEGTPPLVSISCQELAGEWLFSVRDNGLGIDRDYHSKIFDIFQRLNNQHEFPSNGMGLTICTRFVAMHGGKIWVDSLPGYGSTFYFTILNHETPEL